MDYSKVGSKLFDVVRKNEAKLGHTISVTSKPVSFSLHSLDGSDEFILQNSNAVMMLLNDKPINVVVNNLNALGNIAHKFEALCRYKNHTESTQKVEKYFDYINMRELLNAYKEGGVKALYTLFLNKAAIGASPESFNSLNRILNQECKKLKLDSPNVDIWMKGIVNKSDFNFLPWKTKGFVHPKKVTMPDFTDESYNVTRRYNETNRIDSYIPDGYRDPGRQFRYRRDGKLEGCWNEPFARETIVVDRAQDTMLNKTVDVFKNIISRNPYMTTSEKIRTLYTFVDELFKVPNCINLVEQLEMKQMLIGDIISSGAGVCRHNALCAKLLGDTIGLNISLVRGRFLSPNGNIGSHIWNEVKTQDGKKYIFDVSQKVLTDLDSCDDVIKKYYTQNGKSMYVK